MISCNILVSRLNASSCLTNTPIHTDYNTTILSLLKHIIFHIYSLLLVDAAPDVVITENWQWEITLLSSYHHICWFLLESVSQTLIYSNRREKSTYRWCSRVHMCTVHPISPNCNGISSLSYEQWSGEHLYVSHLLLCFIILVQTHTPVTTQGAIHQFCYTVYVVSFDGQNFRDQTLPNIFTVKILLSTIFSCRKVFL